MHRRAAWFASFAGDRAVARDHVERIDFLNARDGVLLYLSSVVRFSRAGQAVNHYVIRLNSRSQQTVAAPLRTFHAS